MRFLGFASVVIFCMIQCSKVVDKETIVIGGIFPLTGSSATYGTSSEQGMQIAIDDINASGGILVDGKKRMLKGVYDDDEGHPEKAANAVHKQVSRNRIKALIGCVMSKNSMAIAPICQEYGIPMVTHGSTNIKVTEAGDFIFRACFIDPFQGLIMAEYVYKHLGLRTAAIIYDNGNDYNKGLSEVFKEKFESFGGKILAYESFTDESSTIDFKAQLTNIKKAKPQFLYSPNYYAADAIIMKQAAEIGLKIPTGGGDGWDSPQLVLIGGKYVEGCVFCIHFATDDPRPIVQNFVQKYTDAYGAIPDGIATLAYDATTIVVKAMQNCGSTDSKVLRDAIQKTDIEGVSGKIKFDDKRNPVKSAVIVTIENGKQKYLTTITPL